MPVERTLMSRKGDEMNLKNQRTKMVKRVDWEKIQK
jgi:ActR/RegA family two-component response regulator